MKQDCKLKELPVPKRKCVFFLGDNNVLYIKNPYKNENYSLDDYVKLLRDAGWDGKKDLDFVSVRNFFNRKGAIVVCHSNDGLDKIYPLADEVYAVLPWFVGNALYHYLELKQEIVKHGSKYLKN